MVGSSCAVSTCSREADAGGLNHYSGQLEQGRIKLVDLKRLFLSSEEGQARTKLLRDAFLEQHGQMMPKTFSASGGTQELDQPSVYEAVRGYYLVELGREPDESGLKNYIGRILRGEGSLEAAQTDIRNSEEAALHRKREGVFQT